MRYRATFTGPVPSPRSVDVEAENIVAALHLAMAALKLSDADRRAITEWTVIQVKEQTAE